MKRVLTASVVAGTLAITTIVTPTELCGRLGDEINQAAVEIELESPIF